MCKDGCCSHVPENAINMGNKLELFIDDHLIDTMSNARLLMHRPQPMPLPQSPFTGSYMTVLKDGDLYRGYFRRYRPDFDGERKDGNPGECTCYTVSNDGIEWTEPELGLFEDDDCGGLKNAILCQAPFAHNFSPFVDTRPGIPAGERYKALAGTRQSGLHAFASADAVRWTKMSDGPVISYDETLHGRLAFDSQNVAFWSAVEQCYLSYFRHFNTPQGGLRTIARAVSADFLHWTDQSADFQAPNLPGEELYTNQTHPYFRAPHIYLALPSRFTQGTVQGEPVEGNYGSTDIMLMTSRAGSMAYQRTFKEAFIRPGPDPERWKNRANYVALNVVPTGPAEMSIYNRSGQRYVLRTDGFASVNALYDGGGMVTRPVVFDGKELILNAATSIRGGVRVELQDLGGNPLPGFGLDDCRPFLGDRIEHVFSWKDGSDLGAYSGTPVRLRFELKDCDLYSMRFR